MDSSKTRCSRREFLSLAVAAPIVSTQIPQVTTTPAATPSEILDVNYRKLLGRADLIYEHPAARSEEGIPVGNGRKGSLVWTVPDALKFQINRVDVYGNDSYTNSFFERHNDYCGGCGFVDIEFGDLGEGGQADPDKKRSNNSGEQSFQDGHQGFCLMSTPTIAPAVIALIQPPKNQLHASIKGMGM